MEPLTIGALAAAAFCVWWVYRKGKKAGLLERDNEILRAKNEAQRRIIERSARITKKQTRTGRETAAKIHNAVTLDDLHRVLREIMPEGYEDSD